MWSLAKVDAPRLPFDPLDPRVERKHRQIVAALVCEQFELCGEIVLERAVPIEVVGREIEHHRRLGGEVERIFQLEGGCLADDRRALLDTPHEAAECGANVARDLHPQAGLAVDVPDQLNGGGLAVRARHGDEFVVEHSPCQLQLAQNRQPVGSCRGNHRRLCGHAGTLDDSANAP